MPTQLFDENLKKTVLASIRMPRLRVERAVILTNSYKETEGEPMILRRAKALRKYAQEIPIDIEDWQLIVGSISAGNFTLSPFPESTCSWIPEMETFGTRDGDKYYVSEGDKNTLCEILTWWKGRSIEDHVRSRMPENVREASEAALIRSGYVESGCGNFLPDYRRILQEGLLGFQEEIKKRIAALELTQPSDYSKRFFYQSALIACDAVKEYANRYSKLARAMAEQEKDVERKRDLLVIARNCERVPWYPAADFSEALQAVWLVHCLIHFEIAGGVGVVLGRMDQYLYSFYLKFKENQGIDETKRWLKNFWINQNQLMYFLPKKTTASIWSGHPISEQPTIGGVTEDGRDASNEFTKLILDVEKEVGLPRPDITVMYHQGIDPEVLHKSCEALPIAMKPKFFNFEILRKHLLAKGATEKEIRTEGVVIGCVSSGVEGKIWGNNQMGFINLGKCLELCLNNGVDMLTGIQIGPTTGDPSTFKTFSNVMDAYKKQLEYATRMAVALAIIIENVHKELNPQPFCSMLVKDCLEKGLPVWEGGVRYNIPGIVGVGLANIADALAAVKKLVFEEKEVDVSHLIRVLRNNWEGEETLRLKMIHQAPKFGNDEDEVDQIAAEVAKHYCEEIIKYKGPRGVSYFPGLYSVSAHVGLGEYVGATPDGRKAKTPMADGMSPVQGAVTKGPTAILRSMTKVDQSVLSTGTLQNMKFSISALKNHEDKFIALLKTYMDLGGYHVQFNIIDTATLVEAQRYPEKYAGLVVRVAAYAAEFTALPKALQDDIIQRSELGLD